MSITTLGWGACSGLVVVLGYGGCRRMDACFEIDIEEEAELEIDLNPEADWEIDVGEDAELEIDVDERCL